EIAGKTIEEFDSKLNLNQQHVKEEEVVVISVDGDDDAGTEDDEEFSFACTNPDGSPISADDLFYNGQIRPIFPLFNRDLLLSDGYDLGDSKSETEEDFRPQLKKLFIEEGESTSASSEPPASSYCEWSSPGKTVREASPETCKKSNSTGFSKLWRFRDQRLRSNSDGKDAFVFLNANHHEINNHNNSKNGVKKDEKVAAGGKLKGKAETTSLSAYMKKRAKESDDTKRKLYLPYKQAGFFTNVNGLSRNLHPF
ncbi:DUF1645 domain-containing protein, partial [Cephalotus follicularis]